MPSLPFTLAGRYRLAEIIGEGGMGRVWAAHDLLLGREVAVKEMVPPPGLSAARREELRIRVIREARAIARVDHPNVVRVIDVLHERGEPWLVMELVAARSLYEVTRRDGPLTPERAAEVGLAVLGALRAAHAQGLLHRDVKPANVLLGVHGRVVLTDFGLASLAGDSSVTATGVVLGSPSYLAPERLLDEPIGPAADLWALGATLYAAVEGKPPYSKSSPAATLAAVANGELPRAPQRAGVLEPALEALLRRDPAQRADGAMAEQLLQAAAAGRRAATGSPGTGDRSRAPDRVVAVDWAGADPGVAKAERTPRGGRRLRPLLISVAAVAVVLATAGFVFRARAQPAPLYRSGAVYQLVNPWAGDSVIDLPGRGDNTGSGARVQLYQNLRDYDNGRDQYWKLVDAPDDGYVNIINESSKLSLGVQDASKENFAKLVQVTTDRGDDNQQWSLLDAGRGRVQILNRNSGRVAELLGDDLGAPKADGSWDGYLVEQFDVQPDARDQEWVLTPR